VRAGTTATDPSTDSSLFASGLRSRDSLYRQRMSRECRAVVGVGLAVAATLIAACGSTSASQAALRAPSIGVRTCSKVGFGGLAADWRRRAVTFGPLSFPNLRQFTAHQTLPGTLNGRYGAYEIVAVVSAGATPVLSLPRSEWATVGLLYNPDKFRNDGAYRIRDMDQAVRFSACKSRSFNHGVSQFDGGFLVTHRQCVRFLVTIPNGPTYRGEFPAAAPCERAA
jgi:hypothetical protein